LYLAFIIGTYFYDYYHAEKCWNIKSQSMFYKVPTAELFLNGYKYRITLKIIVYVLGY
jgi:hypothetical protein